MRRPVFYIAIALAAFWGIWATGYVLFSLGGESPGDGRGQVTTVEGVND
jgi:hypothetical protein